MPAPEFGFSIAKRFKDLGFTYADRVRIHERLEAEGGVRPGEHKNDAAFRIAKLMRAEEDAQKAAKIEASAPAPAAPAAPAANDDEVMECTISMKTTRRALREFFATTI
ncbi:hypothetical protein [Hyphomicrobium sp. 99]|uniref:hypothetical protein n=1 Tax=Hyphomicrobium sp. 99 TaxID=1163419 RepID=UPI0005F78883|nr:hypothetical protein [Hyphomicrobium sp. 99]